MKKIFCTGSILFILNVPFSFGQLNWTKIDTGFGKLPNSIRLYKTSDSLNGRPFIAFYVEADLPDREIEFTTQAATGKRFTPSAWYRSEGEPYLVVNGTFFSFETNQNLNLLMRRGKMLSYNVPSLKSKQADSFYYPTRGAIGIRKNRKADVAWTFTDTAQRWPIAFQENPIIAKGKKSDPVLMDLNTLELWKKWKMQTAIGGGPVVVKNHLVMITNKEEQMFVDGENDKHPRTAMGYTDDNKLIILVIQGRFPGIAEGATLQEEATILIQLGCNEALNLDGGGSSCMLVNGKETIKPSDKAGQQRAVPGVFLIKSSSPIPAR